ncbi:hypothetical protein L6164_019453 [Bauhinia variegata]|uniref:Uncharacterized protein n=1 Tax=Bauhinia variegata TaxID=167791 RepID=A0ACB9MSN3_BAUVA|nr:hypothetical protein L6164_019453 [Bauhinia variegata]
MPSWWGKSSSKEVKRKAIRENFIDSIQRKLKSASEEKCNDKTGGSGRRVIDTVSEKGCKSLVPSRSPSPSAHVSRCQSFAERPHAQPLPLPSLHSSTISRTSSAINVTSKPDSAIGIKPSLFLPLPKPRCPLNSGKPTDAEGDIATASVSSDSSVDSDDPSDSRLRSPLASDCENGNRTPIRSSFSMLHKDQSDFAIKKKSKAYSKPAPQVCNNHLLSTSPKGGPLHVQNLQIVRPCGLCSAPDSSMSSPSRSPMRAFGSEQVLNSAFWAGKAYQDAAFGHCSSPGSGYNSVGGDPSGQIFWPQSRCSPECSPIPSPRMTSPGPGSRIHSGAVTPLHPRAGGGPATESPTRQTHRLPLPPITIANSCPFSPTYSAATTPSAPRSPSRAENPISPGSRWKKGQLLGRGTCGHVYLGFNSESGEMCAMKEVTLFSDDAKSRESAQQLGQEIAMLSRLRHPNIVQYYGSETVDDKLYIYLEYVSGGSIYKLLQEYGQLGEIAIRNYTRQILSGLAYLHAKNTVHRDIKGANILVDPSRRVKLADFGMAKHINGQPFSFKGSPYWMAPEVIKNSNGCSLAVDIWSLGCTVLEMATTKPPWSQYEGVAAMFKIGNSKELPAIPDHLSEDGKDFVRLCLQRNPLHRPTAGQLLEHPFVKNATTERPITYGDLSEQPPAVADAVRSLKLKLSSGSSDAHSPRNISGPVSPSGSPLLHSRAAHVSGRMSPSPISSPHTASGSSTPLTGGSGALPFHQTKLSTFLYEGVGMSQRSQNTFSSNGNTVYHDQFWGISQTTHTYRDIISSDNDDFAKHIRGPVSVQGDRRDFYEGKSFLADCVSQQLLRDHVRLNSSLDLKPSAPMLGRINGL